MTSKSKLNPLTFIIIIAIILFVVAIVWKSTKPDNSEEAYVPVVKQATQIEKKQREVIEDTYDIKSHPVTGEEAIKKQSANMNKHIMFNSAEDVMKVILKLQEQGNEEKANEYIDFLLTRYPDYEMDQ